MTIVIGAFGLALHIALLLLAAPLLTGLIDSLATWMAGHGRTPITRAGWALRHLWVKQTMVADNVSFLSHHAPMLTVVVALLCALLVPSFALGLPLAPCADLITIAGLLAVPPIMQVLVTLDAGTGPAGIAAAWAMRRGVLAQPALLLAMLALAVLAGSGNLEALIADRREALLPAGPAVALAIAALTLLAWDDIASPPLDEGFSGRDLALMRFAAQLRRLTWCDLIGALVLPMGMATANGGPWVWGLGLLAWGGRLLLTGVVLAAMRQMRPHNVVLLLSIALALSGAAVVLGLNGGGA